jgi:tetratricopeptide (TPR) repeat protein
MVESTQTISYFSSRKCPGGFDGKQRANQFVAMVRSEESYDLLADAYALKGDLQGALRTYERAEELFPGSAHIIIRRGEAFVMNHDFPHAEKQFRTVVEENRPAAERREGWRSLSKMFACEGKFLAAYVCYDTVLGINRRMRDTLNLMMSHNQKAFWLMVGTGDSLAARDEVEKATQLQSKIGRFLTFGLRDTYVAMHEYGKADSLGKKYELEFTMEAVKAYTSWARGDYDSAAQYFQILTEHAHVIQNRLYSYDYARLLEAMHQYKRAVEVLLRYQSSYHYSEGTWCAYYPRSFHLLGRIFEEMGEKDRAAEATKVFLSLWKNADRGLPELADARKRLRRLDVRS